VGEIRVARSARRHKIGNTHILAAMANGGAPAVVGDQLRWVACGDRGIELRIIAVPDDHNPVNLTVTHAHLLTNGAFHDRQEAPDA